MFFDRSEPQAIADCVRSFIANERKFSRTDCRQQAKQFSAERFRAQFTASVNGAIERCRMGAGDQQSLPPRMIA
jgi:hypothetical protein